MIIDNIEIDFAEWLRRMKFDCIVMNPPYDGSLHLKILKAVIPHAKKTINISPIGYALVHSDAWYETNAALEN